MRKKDSKEWALLKTFMVMDTSSLNEARQIVGGRFCSHKLEILESTGNFHVKHHAVQGKLLMLNFLSYGDTVRIEPGELENFYLIQIPLAGFAEISNGRNRFISNTKNASILNPDRHTSMIWHANCQQLMIYLPRDNVRRLAEQHLGLQFSHEIVFDTKISFENPSLDWLRRASILMAKAADKGELFNQNECLNQLLYEENFILELIERQPSNIQCYMTSNTKTLAPKNAKIARDYIIENIHHSISIGDITKVCDLPKRTLQHQFQQFFGISPMELLKKERLKRIYSEISSGHNNSSLSEIASKWGFTHLGRFSQHFRKEFGESPSKVYSNAKRLRNYNLQI